MRRAFSWPLLTAALCLWAGGFERPAVGQAPPKNRVNADAPPPKDRVPASDSEAPRQRENQGLPQLSPLDKLLAAEAVLGPKLRKRDEEAWAGIYKGLYDKFAQPLTIANLNPTRAVLALALGVKATDGVLALKAREVGDLNKCAEQIEKLADKLDVPGKQLERASLVREQARMKHWPECFLELGFLQRQVMRSLEENSAQQDEAKLVVLGGWLEGGRCITSLILDNDNYSTETSNLLREPKMVQLIHSEMMKVKEKYRSDPVVADILNFLPVVQKKVDVGLYAAVPKEDVRALFEGFDRLVRRISAPKGSDPGPLPASSGARPGADAAPPSPPSPSTGTPLPPAGTAPAADAAPAAAAGAAKAVAAAGTALQDSPPASSPSTAPTPPEPTFFKSPAGIVTILLGVAMLCGGGLFLLRGSGN